MEAGICFEHIAGIKSVSGATCCCDQDIQCDGRNAMTDWVSVRNLRLHGHHGVFPDERRNGQEFELDIDCAVDAAVCVRDDDYESAVCYVSLCDLARSVSQEGPFRLIETLADRLAQRILSYHPAVLRVVVNVRKPSAPINAEFDWVGVKVDRSRTR